MLGEGLKVTRLMRELAVVERIHPDDGKAGEETIGPCSEARDPTALRPGADRR